MEIGSQKETQCVELINIFTCLIDYLQCLKYQLLKIIEQQNT